MTTPSPDVSMRVLKFLILSYRMTNLPLFARFLYESKTSVARMSSAFVAAPLHCLSQKSMIRSVSWDSPTMNVPCVLSCFRMNEKFSRINMLVIVHFLPIRWLSLVPCGMSTIVSESVWGPGIVFVIGTPRIPSDVSDSSKS